MAATPHRLPLLWLLLPAGLLYGGLALYPLAGMLQMSLTEGWGHYAEVTQGRLLWRAATNTVAISLTTTAIALLLGYVLAAGLWRCGPATRALLLAFIMLPFWTAVLVKNFAWAALLQDNGVVNGLLQWAGLTTAPVTLLHNRLAVIIGMVHYVLPYAVFPIYTAMRGIDLRVERAARSLGAGTLALFWTVLLPLTMPGVLSAGLLAFIVSAGFYVTPVVLGSPSDMMVSNLVSYYVHELVDFNAAAALAMLILAAITPVIVLQQFASRGQHGGG
ncbi:ABC transporter permease [Siccirubricoccus phaeus]|uniref:ABC transporter permease n=1 Tax=Siccirubricoccus phaeus TaxID=2595053 RepID=UPI001A9CB4B8|nr:ABC transporter permease [Siccirubricoccus phaeus]